MLGWAVVDRQSAVAEVKDKRGPLVRGARRRLADRGLRQNPWRLVGQSVRERGEYWGGVLPVRMEGRSGDVLRVRVRLKHVEGAGARQRLKRPHGVGEAGVEQDYAIHESLHTAMELKGRDCTKLLLINYCTQDHIYVKTSFEHDVPRVETRKEQD